MRKGYTTITYCCKSCEKDLQVDVYPIIPAQLYGPPENCYPEEGGEIEPEECSCGEKVDVCEAHELAGEKVKGDREYYAEQKADRDRDWD